MLTCRSYGKINLYLDVLPRRSDGFHDIETVFQTIDWYDELTFSPASPGELGLTCNRADLAIDSGNLVWRAADLLRRHTGCTQGVKIHLRKNIPIAAGLAGGSGNAAATLAALNQLWGLGLSLPALQSLALELGSDVPYCLTGGLAIGTGRGEILQALAPLRHPWAFILVAPGIPVSAAQAYGHSLLTKNTEPLLSSGHTASFERALSDLAAEDLPSIVYNRLEAPIFTEYPELARIKEDLLRAGCCAAAMSGSGSVVFGLCDGEDVAKRIIKNKVCSNPAGIFTPVFHGVSIEI